MFDSQFYATALSNLVRGVCAGRSDCTPVVQLHLADGTVLDICDVLQLSDGWLGLAYHRDGTCTGSDFAFLPHAVVTRVSVSLQPAQDRKLGFRHGQAQAAATVAGHSE